MRFEPAERRVRLAVGELAAFRLLPAAVTQRGGLWRLEVGRQWHRQLQETPPGLEKAEAPAGDRGSLRVENEVALEGKLAHGGWTLHLQGRIDQVVHGPGERALLREIKTVRTALPRPEAELREAFPDYFRQAALYLLLARSLPDWSALDLRAELVLVDIGEGRPQHVPLPGDPQELLRPTLDAFVRFAEHRFEARRKLRSLTLRPAFAEPRPGQETIGAELEAATGSAPVTLFEAPTGYGKTGVVLDFALRGLQEGRFERLVYLTGKSTGQMQALRQLTAMTGGEGAVRTVQVRGRAELARGCPLPCAEGLHCAEQDNGNGFFPPGLFGADGALGPEDFLALAGAHRRCPYEIARTCLPYAEVWLGDYNYVFSPRHSGLFEGVPGYEPSNTLLLVDEAHNLPERAAAARSLELESGEVVALLDRLQSAGALHGPRLPRALETLARFLDGLSESGAHRPETAYEAADLLDDLQKALQEEPPETEAAGPGPLNLLWEWASGSALLADETLDLLPWSPRRGRLHLTCLDASAALAQLQQSHAQCLLLSATFGPPELFTEQLGLETGGWTHLPAEAPWREGACTVAVDTRVDTRFSERARHYATTAETLAAMSASAPGEAVAAIFPSYRYAGEVRARVEALGLRTALPPRGVSLAEQTRFLEEALLGTDLLFLVAGSGFTESIDVLGGRVRHAVVVGPALPEVNAVQRARLERLGPLGREEAFRRVYLVPALQKINQALGRLVRAPGHRAKILLHGQRFARPEFQQLLDGAYRGGEVVRNDADLARWLQEPLPPG